MVGFGLDFDICLIKILVQGNTSIKIVSKDCIHCDASLDGIKLVSLDSIQLVTDFALWVNPSVPVLYKAIHDGMLRPLNVYIFLKIPAMLLSIVNGCFEPLTGCFELVFRLGCHVVKSPL
jgi:hypothetical protein